MKITSQAHQHGMESLRRVSALANWRVTLKGRNGQNLAIDGTGNYDAPMFWTFDNVSTGLGFLREWVGRTGWWVDDNGEWQSEKIADFTVTENGNDLTEDVRGNL